jgi:hypothetical protein
MNSIKVAKELVKLAKELTAEDMTIDGVVDFTESELKRVARHYGLDTIYSQAAHGQYGVHCGLGGGNFTIWFEEDGGEFEVEASVSGEAHARINEVWWNELDGKKFDSIEKWKHILKNFFLELDDVESELLPEEMEA